MKNKKYLKILIIVILLSILSIFIFSFAKPFTHPLLVREGVNSQIGVEPLSGEKVKVSLFVMERKYEGEFKEGSTVFEVMQKIKEESKPPNLFDFKYTKHTGMGIFIEEVNGKKGGRDGYWIYSVNGVEANIGVSNYKINDGDVISWKYEK